MTWTISRCKRLRLSRFRSAAPAPSPWTPTKIRSEADEAVKLSHELGHCVYGGFYNKYTPFDVRAQHENKANAWAVRRLIPWAKLKQAVKSGITEVWDLAEYFDVTEDFMRWAITYYTERKNYKFE